MTAVSACMPSSSASEENRFESPVAGRLRLIPVTELFSIGQLARTTGLPVRTVRFWSDLGLVPPAGRTSGNYRMFDAEAAARLDLVRTLRELGIDLDTVGQVLREQITVADVA